MKNINNFKHTIMKKINNFQILHRSILEIYWCMEVKQLVRQISKLVVFIHLLTLSYYYYYSATQTPHRLSAQIILEF